MDDIKISIEGCNTEVSMANNAAEDFAKEAKNSANLALEQANRAKEIVDNSTENIESAKNQAIENAKYSIEEYQTTVLANLENSAGNLKNDMTNSMLTILDSTKQQADIAKYYAEQEHGQSDVTQNDLWTLERKTLFPTFEIRDESNILNELKTQRASSFDKSKFAIVGTPAITDDGVASGFSSSDYISKAIELSDFVCEFHIKLNGALSTDLIYFYTNDTSRLVLYSRSSTNTFSLYINGGATYEMNPITDWYGEYDSVLTQNGSTVTLKLYQNGTLVNERTATYTETISDIKGFYLAPQKVFVNNSFTGSIDLKQFSITVDGKEVFSGNKTGLDVIKADDYKVVGSPVISEDGIASGFGDSDYLQLFSNSIDDNYNTFEMNCKISYPSEGLTNEQYTIGGAGGRKMIFGLSRGKFLLFLGTDGSSWDVAPSSTGTFRLTANTYYYVKLKFDGSKYTLDYSLDGINYINDITVTTSTKFLLPPIININNVFGGHNFRGSIDLNSFKIYVDGNLVCQPCLKIPYTQAKLNHKIVDAVYRDRVQDLFEQVGYNGYFTLGENDFTLPSNKWSDVIDCYENGINKWEQRVDRTLRQQGSCTADEEVTLLKPYKDTNYVLNVPYASKTETGFIPTISGDWVANGKVYLD